MPQIEHPCGFVRTPDGLSLRYGYWPYRGENAQGTVLVLQGRSEFIEKYQETVDELLVRRMDVFSFDWRGQGASDRMLLESEKGFVHCYDQYLEDLDLILQTIVIPRARNPLFLLCHSMGGHIGLRYLGQFPHVFSKAVFSAPMIDVQTRPLPRNFVRWFTRHQIAMGYSHKAVIGSSWSTPFPARFHTNRLTSDRQRFDRTRKMVAECPQLSAADVTYGWLAATFDSIDILRQPCTAQALDIPLLFVRAGKERIVSCTAIEKFAGMVPHAQLVTIKNARHEILQEGDQQRRLFWQAFDDFMHAKAVW